MTRLSIVDAHQHFWCLATPGHQWPDASLPAIHRDFGTDDLRAEAQGVDLAATVLVQSQPTDLDTDWLCALAADEALVGAVVGWVDFAAPNAPARIAELSHRPKLRGLRPMLQSIADEGWIMREELAPAITAMMAHRLSFDALIQPRHLPTLRRFAMRWPDLPIVIDHGAKPQVAGGQLDPWRAEIETLARLKNVWCKLSGLRTEQAAGDPIAALAPYVTHLVETFGARLMWGSDWPVLRTAGDDYGDWLNAARSLAALDDKGESMLFVGAARLFYRF